MALDPQIEHVISTTIEGNFPEYYREHGPVLVGFVRKYFEWMESEGQVLNISRRIPEIKDIDTTSDEFIVYFKEKYLKNIQLETTSNVRQLVKHSLDIYRSRGSERAIDLLFRLVFGAGASVYLPSSDIWQLSAGRWVRPVYLEVTYRDTLTDFVGKQVTGIESGATGFVERYIRRKGPAKFVDVLYISAVDGNFKTGEIISSDATTNYSACPRVIGSLSDLNVTVTGTGYSVGDLVDVQGSGYNGEARVTETSDVTGLVTFSLQDGGYGYSPNAQVLVSDTVIIAQNVTPDPGMLGREFYFSMFDRIVQPMANVTFANAVGSFVPGMLLTAYANNVAVGNGAVVSVRASNSTFGSMVVSVYGGTLNGNLATAGNVQTANVTAYADQTAVSNCISETLDCTISYSTTSGSFQINETVTGPNGAAATVTFSTPSQVTVTDRLGVFAPGMTITGALSGATAVVSGVSLQVGMFNTQNSFVTSPYALIRGSTSNTQFFPRAIGIGTGAAVTVSKSFLDTETVSLNSDRLAPYANVALSAARSFPANPNTTLSTVIGASLSYANTQIGRLQYLIGQNGGTGYTLRPLVRVYDPATFIYRKRGWTVNIQGATGSFSIGEIVTQASTGARGMVLDGSSTAVISADRLSFLGEFAPTTNASSQIVGSVSGSVANVTFVAPGTIKRSYNDIGGRYIGVNADIDASTASSNGAATALAVTDSGFGYIDQETVSFAGREGQTPGQAITGVKTQGIGSGYYREKGGFLSDQKKLRDGYYYQEFSYEVRSSVTLEKYKDMLKQILHVAGTISFGSLRMQSEANVAATIPLSSLDVFRNVGVTYGYGSFSITSPGAQNLVGRLLVAAGAKFQNPPPIEGAILQRQATLAAGSGRFTKTHVQAKLFDNHLITPDTSPINLAGSDAQLLNTRTLTMVGRSFTMGGKTMTPGIMMPAAGAKFQNPPPIEGAILLANHIVTAAGVRYATSGQQATLQTYRKGQYATASYSITSTGASFGLTMPAGYATFQNPPPIEGANLYAARFLTAGARRFALTGGQATMNATYPISAQAGSYSLSGGQLAALYGHRVVAQTGQFSNPPPAPTATFGVTMPAGYATFATPRSTSASLIAGHRVVAQNGQFALAGQQTTLSRTIAAKQSMWLSNTAQTPSDFSLTNSNTTVTLSNQNDAGAALRADQGRSSGKYVFEYVIATNNNGEIGIGPTQSGTYPSAGYSAGFVASSWMLDNNGDGTCSVYLSSDNGQSVTNQWKYNNGAWNVGQAIQFYVDFTQLKLYIRVNGSDWFGNVASGANGIPLSANTLYPIAAPYNTVPTLHTLANTFANSIASGYTAWGGG